MRVFVFSKGVCMRRYLILSVRLCAILSVVCCALPAFGQKTWTGLGDPDQNWSTGANWNGGTPPVATNTLTFAGSTNVITNNDFAVNTAFNALTFSNNNTGANTGAFTLNGNAITLGGNITTTATTSGTLTDTINLGLRLNANRTVTTNANHHLNITGPVTSDNNARTLIKAGEGTLTLSNPGNTYGATQINNGTLKLGASDVLPNTTVTVNANAANRTATLDLNGFNETIGALTLGGTGATASSVHQVIDSQGGGLLTLGGNVTFTATGNPTTSALIGSDLSLGALTRTFTIGDSTGNNFTHNVDLLVSGVVSATDAAAGIIKLGAGNLQLSAENTFGGLVHIQAGTLTVNELANTGTASGLGTGNDNSVIRIGNTSTTATLQYVGTGDSTNRQIQIGAGGSTNTGGAIIENNGTGAITFTNSVFNVQETTTGARTLTLGGSNTGNNTIQGVIQNNATGVVNIAKRGEGQWILEGANTYTGTTTINNGTLKLGANDVLSSGTVTVNANGPGFTATLDINGKTDAIGALTLGGTGATASSVHQVIDSQGGGLLTLGGNVTFNATGNPTTSALISSDLSLGAASRTFAVNDSTGAAIDLIVTGDISATAAAAGLTKSGLGTLELAGSNTYTGTTTLSAGRLKLTGTNSISGNMTANRGTLILDYQANNTSKLDDTRILTLGGATVELVGGTHTELVASTALTALTSSTITRSSGSAILELNNITPSTGTLHFNQSGIATTNNLNNPGGILGGWATVSTPGGVDWATNSTNAADGLITAFSGYTDITRLGPSSIADNAATSVRIIDGGVAGDITLASPTTNINSLKMDATGGSATIAIANGQLLRLGTTGGVLMDADAGALTINGTGTGALTVGAGAAANAAGTIVLSNHSLANPLTVGAIIQNNGSGAVSVTKSGPGEAILSGANSYTGATFVAGGTLTIQNNLALGGPNSGTTVWLGSTLQLQGGITVGNEALTLRGTGVNGNGALHSSGNNSWGGLITISETASIVSNAGTLTIDVAAGNAMNLSTTTIFGGTGDIVINDNVIGNGIITKTGTGTLILNAQRTGNGATTINNGTLMLGVNNALTSTGAMTINATGPGQTATFDINGKTVTHAGAITLGGTGATSSSVHQIIDSAGGGLLTLGSSVTFTATGNPTNSALISSNLSLGSATRTFSVADSLGNNASHNVDLHVSGDISSTAAAAGITKTSAGNLLLSGNNTFDGLVHIQAGTLSVTKLADAGFASGLGTGNDNSVIRIGNTSATATLRYVGTGDSTDRQIQIGAGGGANAGGAIIENNGSGAITFTNSVFNVQETTTGARTLTLGGSNTGNNTIQGVIQNNNPGAVAVTKRGNGTWVLAGANTYTGATTVNAGKLVLDFDASDTSKLSDTAALTLGGGTLELKGGTHQEIVSATTLTASTASTITRNGGTSVIRLNAITQNTGSVLHFGGESIASTDRLNIASVGILGSWATIDGPNGIEWAVNSTNGLDGLITAYNGYTDVNRLSGVIANSTNTNVQIVDGGAPGNVTLGAATTVIYSLKMDATAGPSTIMIGNGESLKLGTAGGILMDADAGALTITSTGTGRLTSGGTSTTAAGTIVLNNASTTNAMTIQAPITNNGTGAITLTKAGLGDVVLSGTNTYSGTTNVAAGTLYINGSVANGAITVANGATLYVNGSTGTGAVTVREGATLAGVGTVGGLTTIQSGGNHSPGQSPGIQTFAAGLTYNAGSTFTWELTGNTATPSDRGVEFDGVNVTGGLLTIGTGVISSLVFSDALSSVLWSDAFWQAEQQWLVFQSVNTTTSSAAIFDAISVSLDSAGNPLIWGEFYWSRVGTDVYLNFRPVPEPGTLAVFGLGFGAMLVGRRWRQRSRLNRSC